MNKSLLLILYLLCLSGTMALGQSPQFYSHNFGKIKNPPRVLSMAHDDFNQIYFGTGEGLYHYDGLSYNKIGLGDSLANFQVSALAFYDQKLWVGTSTGSIYLYDEQGLRPLDHPTYNGRAKITDICPLANGVAIATYGDGIYIVPEEGELQHLNAENGLNDDYTYDILVHGNEIWTATDAGISRMDFEGKVIAEYRMKDGLPDNIVHVLLEVDQNHIAVGMYDYGVGLINTNDFGFQSLAQEGTDWNKGPVESMVLDSEKRLWIGTRQDGVVMLELEGDNTEKRVFTEINGLNSNKVLCLMADLEKNVWIGTQAGASLYTGATFEFISASEGLEGENTFDVLEDKFGNIWLANSTGVQLFSYSGEGDPQLTTIIDYQQQGIDQVICIFEAQDGALWFGTYGNGLLKYDRISGKTLHYSTDDGLLNNNIMDIAQDSKGRLWLATLGGGLVCANIDEGELAFEHIGSDWYDISSYIYSIHLDESQRLWFGTDGSGLQAYDCKSDHLIPLQLPTIAGKTVYSIATTSMDEVWFSTADDGIYRFKPHDPAGTLHHFEAADGLRTNGVIALCAIANDNVFVVHELGIDYFVPEKGGVIPYNIDRKDYVFEPNLNGSQAAGQSIFIGTENGIVKFSPFSEDREQLIPKIRINSLRVMFEHVDIGDEMSFAHDQNHVVIEYLGIWMKKPESIVYKYILEGFDVTWSYETKGHIATYSNLPPGEYVFKVSACNDLGNWSNADESAIRFTILKPFWKEWWFFLLVIALGIAAVTSFIRYRTHKLIADKQALESEVQKRTREISHQKNIIEHKNKEILASITYAKRIQEAILPPARLLLESLPESFVFYKPKDIVAGDFYWLESLTLPNADELVIFAAADCTGHGVPGAMVSVVCHNALNRAVREFGLTVPAEILNKTRDLVVQTFEKSDEEVKDGMDIALCALNTSSNELQYSGAHNPLWIVSKHPSLQGYEDLEPITENGFKLFEIKADKQPIGKYAEPGPFTNHKIKINNGDTIYIFTDGYADQFGGPKGKKFKYKTLKSLLLQAQTMNLAEQGKLLDVHFEDWRGDLEQIDDVCLIGVKV